MKKLSLLLLSIILLSSILMGCGKKIESLDSDLLIGTVAQGEALAETESEATDQPVEGLQITLNGENEAVLTLKSKSIGILDSVKEGYSGRILNEICITFESKDGSYYIQADIVDTSCTIYKINNDTDESEWYFSSDEYTDELGEERTEDSYTIKIRQLGIAKDFSECMSYRAKFRPHEESGVVEILAEGNVSDILSEGEKQQRLQVFLPDEDTVKFKIYGEEAKTSFYNYENMRIDIYETEEQMNADNPCPSIEFQVGAAGVNSGEGTYAQDEKTGQSIHNSEFSQGQALGTEYGVVTKYNGESIFAYVKPEYFYELYMGDAKEETGKISDIFIENEYTNIPAIPEEFVSGDEYDSWFVPITDNYRIIGVNQTFSYGTPGWYTTGLWKYDNIGPVVDEYVRTIYLVSLDEFGLIDVKIKVIYESATGLKADIMRNYGFIAAEILGDGRNEPDDSLVTIEALDPLDKEVFTNAFYDTTTTDYLGHSDNVRYFCYNYLYSNRHMSDNMLSPINNWGAYGVSYKDLQYGDKVTERTYQYECEDGIVMIPYVSYSYEQNPVITDYEAERAKYNTAPDDWKEHPYASYIPQIPSGITVDYVEGNTVNETNLALCTEDNGCTKEQAESYLEAFDNMEYENEILELRTEVTEDYEYMLTRHLEGNIRIYISWRVETQRLYIYVDKQ